MGPDIEPPSSAERIGDDALSPRWFFRSRFALIDAFREDFRLVAEERDILDARMQRAIAKAKRAENVRLAVTVLLVLGALVTAGAAMVGALLPGNAAQVAQTLRALDRITALTGSATVLLVAARLAIDRHIARIETTATFLAMRLAR